MQRTLQYALAGLLLALVLIYLGDYAVLRYRISNHQNATEQVTIKPYYAIQMKNKDTEFEFLPPYVETCANSLFPHMGMQPCWYEKKHTEKRTDLFSFVISTSAR